MKISECLKMLRDNKTPGGPSVGKLVQREDLSHQNYTKVYFQDEFLISITFWNKLFFCFQKKKNTTKYGLNKCEYDFVPLSRSEESLVCTDLSQQRYVRPYLDLCYL